MGVNLRCAHIFYDANREILGNSQTAKPFNNTAWGRAALPIRINLRFYDGSTLTNEVWRCSPVIRQRRRESPQGNS